MRDMPGQFKRAMRSLFSRRGVAALSLSALILAGGAGCGKGAFVETTAVVKHAPHPLDPRKTHPVPTKGALSIQAGPAITESPVYKWMRERRVIPAFPENKGVTAQGDILVEQKIDPPRPCTIFSCPERQVDTGPKILNHYVDAKTGEPVDFVELRCNTPVDEVAFDVPAGANLVFPDGKNVPVGIEVFTCQDQRYKKFYSPVVIDVRRNPELVFNPICPLTRFGGIAAPKPGNRDTVATITGRSTCIPHP